MLASSIIVEGKGSVASMRFRLNQPQIVYETFEGEVLAINLDSGTYYSIPGMSAKVWGWLIDGVPVESVRRAMLASCIGDGPTIEADLRSFVHRLETEKLIAPIEDASDAEEPQMAVPAPTPYTPLTIDGFTDMQDLLLLDPIHDVEQEGWPLVRNPENKRDS